MMEPNALAQLTSRLVQQPSVRTPLLERDPALQALLKDYEDVLAVRYGSSHEAALAELLLNSGTQFRPKVVAVLTRIIEALGELGRVARREIAQVDIAAAAQAAAA